MTINRVRRQIQSLYSFRQPMRRQYVALIGHPDGRIDDPEHNGYVFVRIEGQDDRVRHALCRTLVPRYNLAVKVAYNDEWPDRLEVIDEETAGFPPSSSDPEAPSSWTGPTVGRHASQHELAGGDTVYIQSVQFMPLGAFQTNSASMRIAVKAGWYAYATGGNYFPGALTEDFTPYLPSSSGKINWRIVYIEGSTNVLGYTQTGDVDYDILAIETIIDNLGVERVPICAVALVQGMASITQPDIFDIRLHIGAMPGTVTGRSVLWGNVKLVSNVSPSDYLTIQAGIDAAVNDQTILVLPGTMTGYSENLTHKNRTILQNLSGLYGDVIVNPASGVPLTIPSVFPLVGLFEVNGLTINPPASQPGVLFAATPGPATATFRRCRITNGGVEALDASSAGVFVNLDHCYITGDVAGDDMTFIDCVIDGSVSCGDVEIYGGEITGALTIAGGALATLRNLPRVGGTVTGAVVGNYLDSSGNMIVPPDRLIDGVDVSSLGSSHYLYLSERFV